MQYDDFECPLCLEPIDSDDASFYPCPCLYQVCRFCWAKILNEESGLCPACRKPYDSEAPAVFVPHSLPTENKKKPYKKKKEPSNKPFISKDTLKLLPEFRVIQTNLVFVVGLPQWIAKDKEILKCPQYFGQFGKIFKVEVNTNQTFTGPQGQSSISAYITYCRPQDAMRAVLVLDQSNMHGRQLRVSLGTTKYCSQFLRGHKCNKHECMYLHELGDSMASFTKEQMQSGKHTDYMKKLLESFINSLSEDDPLSDHFTQPITPINNTDNTITTTSQPPHNTISMQLQNTCFIPRAQFTHQTNVKNNYLMSSTSDSKHLNLLDDNRSCSNKNPICGVRELSHCASNKHENHPNTNASGSMNFLTSNISQQAPRETQKIDFIPALIDKDNRKSDRLNALYSHAQSSTNNQSSNNYILNYDAYIKDSNRHKDNYEPNSSHNQNLSSSQSQVQSSTNNTCMPAFNTSNLSCTSFSNLPKSEALPVDIGFDPILESQQGLAELIAAENVFSSSSSESTRLVKKSILNSHNINPYESVTSFNESQSINTVHTNYYPSQDEISTQTVLSFAPPPGFEDFPPKYYSTENTALVPSSFREIISQIDFAIPALSSFFSSLNMDAFYNQCFEIARSQVQETESKSFVKNSDPLLLNPSTLTSLHSAATPDARNGLDHFNFSCASENSVNRELESLNKLTDVLRLSIKSRSATLTDNLGVSISDENCLGIDGTKSDPIFERTINSTSSTQKNLTSKKTNEIWIPDINRDGNSSFSSCHPNHISKDHRTVQPFGNDPVAAYGLHENNFHCNFPSERFNQTQDDFPFVQSFPPLPSQLP